MATIPATARGDMSEPTCVDLRPWATANRYRWRYEQGHSSIEPDAEWFVEVLCRHGLIYPKGGNILLAYANRGVKRHIANLAGIERHQWDDDAEVFRFPAELLDDVAAILKPKRLSGPVQLTDEHREILKQYAFRGGQESLESTQGHSDGKSLG